MNFLHKMYMVDEPQPQPQTEKRSIYDIVLGFLPFSIVSDTTYAKENSLKLSTVFRCVNLLSDSIASLPLNTYTYTGNWKSKEYNDLYYLLNVQPNQFQSAFTFKKMLVQLMLLKGNAYILINRNSKGIQSLTIIPNEKIEVVVKNNDIKYKVDKVLYDKSQIIHLLNVTEDGINGLSTVTYAANSLGIASASDSHSRNFFTSGANLAGILKPVAGANIPTTIAQKAKEKMQAATNPLSGGTSNSVVVLESGYEYQPISISPRDSQLLESRQFNVIDICRFFNVPPSLAFSETGKYSTSEQQQIDFLTNSLTPLIEKIENEFFRKIYLKSEWGNKELRFNTTNIFRLDAATRASYLTQLFNIGAYTVNEIRELLDADFPLSGGNRGMISQNMQPLDNILNDIKGGNNNNKE